MAADIWNGKRSWRGFTLVELLVVLLLVALLASLVSPIAISSVLRAQESTLKHDLKVIRKAIDDYYADTGKYPDSLSVLVDKRYIRAVPVDPITNSTESWVLKRAEKGGVNDIHSGSDKESSDGTRYQDW